MAKTHSLEKRTFALEVLERNSLNYAKTARETGISKPTLEKWYLEKQHRSAPQMPDVEINAETVKEAILKRIYMALPFTEDIEKLAKTLNVIWQFYPNNKPENKPGIYERIRQELEKKNK